MEDKKYIATKLALISLVLVTGVISVSIGSYIFPVAISILLYIMTTDWKKKFEKEKSK